MKINIQDILAKHGYKDLSSTYGFTAFNSAIKEIIEEVLKEAADSANTKGSAVKYPDSWAHPGGETVIEQIIDKDSITSVIDKVKF